MMLPPPAAARLSSASAAATALVSRCARQAFSRSIWSRSASSDTVMIASMPPVSGEGSVSRYLLTPTTICSPRSIASSRARVRFDQLLLHVAALDRGDRAAHLVDALAVLPWPRAFSASTLRVDHRRAVEHVAVFEQVGLVGEDLLHAQRPLLVPRPRQAERLVPGRQLHGAGARVLRQRHRQHLDQDAGDVVLRLRLGQAERIHLHAVAEQPLLGIGDAVALARDLVPQIRRRRASCRSR